MVVEGDQVPVVSGPEEPHCPAVVRAELPQSPGDKQSAEGGTPAVSTGKVLPILGEPSGNAVPGQYMPPVADVPHPHAAGPPPGQQPLSIRSELHGLD